MCPLKKFLTKLYYLFKIITWRECLPSLKQVLPHIELGGTIFIIALNTSPIVFEQVFQPRDSLIVFNKLLLLL